MLYSLIGLSGSNLNNHNNTSDSHDQDGPLGTERRLLHFPVAKRSSAKFAMTDDIGFNILYILYLAFSRFMKI